MQQNLYTCIYTYRWNGWTNDFVRKSHTYCYIYDTLGELYHKRENSSQCLANSYSKGVLYLSQQYRNTDIPFSSMSGCAKWLRRTFCSWQEWLFQKENEIAISMATVSKFSSNWFRPLMLYRSGHTASIITPLPVVHNGEHKKWDELLGNWV